MFPPGGDKHQVEPQSPVGAAAKLAGERARREQGWGDRSWGTGGMTCMTLSRCMSCGFTCYFKRFLQTFHEWDHSHGSRLKYVHWATSTALAARSNKTDENPGEQVSVKTMDTMDTSQMDDWDVLVMQKWSVRIMNMDQWWNRNCRDWLLFQLYQSASLISSLALLHWLVILRRVPKMVPRCCFEWWIWRWRPGDVETFLSSHVHKDFWWLLMDFCGCF